MSNNILCELKNVEKQYQQFTLQDINLQISAGTVVGLIGENGAGKTTMLKTMLDIAHKTKGEISFFGTPLSADERNIKDQIGVVFEDCSFPEMMNAKQVNSVMKHI